MRNCPDQSQTIDCTNSFRPNGVSQQHNGIILLTTNRLWLGLQFDDRGRDFRKSLLASERTKIAVVAGALLAIFALVAIQGLARFHQRVQQWNQTAAAFGQLVLDPAWQAAIIISQDDLVLFHLSQPAHQSTTADRVQVFKQFCGALGTGAQITDHQHGPFVADQLQRAGYRTAIDLTSSQSLFLSRREPHSPVSFGCFLRVLASLLNWQESSCPNTIAAIGANRIAGLAREG